MHTSNERGVALTQRSVGHSINPFRGRNTE
jgi:hypothetical protein